MDQISHLPSFASLPWYDLPEVRHATDELWDSLANELRRAGLPRVPAQLNRDLAYERQWRSGNFLFGQACGYDVRVAYADQLQVVATPCYDVPGCDGANYCSYIVVREDAAFDCVEDLRSSRCVINTLTSHSGMNVLRALVAPLHCDGRFFSEVHMSGSHERSLRMIQSREVDVAAIDCVTYALLKRYRPDELRQCRVLDQTQRVASPPYVTTASTNPAALARVRNAVCEALSRPSLAGAKRTLMLSDIKVLPDDAYYPIQHLESMADGHDYWEIPGTLSNDAGMLPPNAYKTTVCAELSNG